MPEKKEADTTTSVAQDLIHWDMGRLDGAFGKNKTSKNMLELMQNQLAFQQMRTMSQDLQSGEMRRKIEDAKLNAAYAAGLPAPAAGQAHANPGDTFAKLFTNPEFMAQFQDMSPETQEKVINSVIQASMMQGQGGMGGNNMIPFLMMMQQSQQKPPTPEDKVTAKDMVVALTEGIKLGQNSNQNQQNTNPVEMFNAISTAIKPYQEAANSLQDKLIDSKLEALKDASQPMTFEKTIAMIKTTNDIFGGHQSVSDADVSIARLTSETRLKEIELNLDAKKMAEEAKSENMKWQQIGGLLTTIGAGVAPSVMNAMSAGAQGLTQGHQPQQPQQQQSVQQVQPQTQPQISAAQRFAQMRCDNCGGTFDIASNPDGSWKTQARCPHCRDILEVDMDGAEEG